MTDIVERLRATQPLPAPDVYLEAVAEIERLRAALDEIANFGEATGGYTTGVDVYLTRLARAALGAKP